jgi:hypothetical protein
MDNDNHPAEYNTTNSSSTNNENNEHSVSLEVHVRAANSQQPTSSATASGSQPPTEQESLTDIMLTEENLHEANATTECILVQDTTRGGTDPNKLTPAFMYCFGKLNAERSFQQCSPGVHVSVINRAQGVLKIEAGACTHTHTHGDTGVMYTMQQGQTCVFSVNGMLSKHVIGDVVSVPQSKHISILHFFRLNKNSII